MKPPVNILEVERKDYHYPIIRRLLGIPADEPLFLIRGKDTLAYEVVQDYCERGITRRLPEDLISSARHTQDAIKYHLEAIAADVPDLPQEDDHEDKKARAAATEKRARAVESLLDEMDRGEPQGTNPMQLTPGGLAEMLRSSVPPDKICVAKALTSDELTAHASPAGFKGGTKIGVYQLMETARVTSLLLDRTPHEINEADNGK